jgi:hypothetical protein
VGPLAHMEGRSGKDMKEQPIIFQGEMIRAILDGRKTMMRKPIKPQPEWISGAWYWKSLKYDNGMGVHYFHTTGLNGIMDAWLRACPHGQPGDRLWVRETWYCDHMHVQSGPYLKPDDWQDGWFEELMYFKASDDAGHGHCYSGFAGETFQCPWKPSIHMPRWASRITLEITDVKVERLQEIRINDVLSEGFPTTCEMQFDAEYRAWTMDNFSRYWNSLYPQKPEYQWKANPWVWVISFKKID